MIDQAVGSNFLDNAAGHRPLRAKSTICRRNSDVYLTPFSAISNTSKTNIDVSTKTGQLHTNQFVEVNNSSFGY
jgi:hypothetical protein